MNSRLRQGYGEAGCGPPRGQVCVEVCYMAVASADAGDCSGVSIELDESSQAVRAGRALHRPRRCENEKAQQNAPARAVARVRI